VADVNANIGVNIDTSAALAQLKLLQREFSAFNSAIVKSNTAALMKQRDIAIDLMRNVSATGKFSAEMRNISTSTESFTQALETNKLTLKEYFRYGVASTKTFGKTFTTEFDTISKVARERVKDLQTRYVKMGRDANGAMKAIAIRPLVLDMEDYATKTMMAAQKQQLFNQLLKQGSTNLLNFGKNTQWAGRQLMVGFTIPLTMLGSLAARTFMDMEKEVVKFKRVYGDMFTSTAQTDQALADIQALGKEFTKYGVAVKDTMSLAAEAAQAGYMGADLMAQTANANKLAVLGQVDQQQALQTTISLQNAFGLSAQNLTDSINFLNAVENQTVTSIEDLTIAIPKAGPVVKSLGGDVKDLAFFLTAMKEGGINASEGANALKSGLASLINPTKKASEFLAGMGINIQGIVEGNKGNLRATVEEFARALDTLDPLNRARAIEQLFGKFQFARLSTLFQNVIQEGNQASRVMELAGRSTQQLAILSERELGTVSDSINVKFAAAIENLKKELMPLGMAFLEAALPVIKFVSSILEKFNGLSDGTKKMIAIITAAVGAVGPVLLMTFGLLANGIANVLKLFASLRNGYLRLTGQSKTLGLETSYMTSEQIKNAAAAASLEQVHTTLTQIYSGEATALQRLITALRTATQAQRDFAMSNPQSMLPGYKPSKKFSSGTTRVPGTGNRDTVASMLTPGEAVIPAGTAQDPANKPIIAALVSGQKVRGYNQGTVNAGVEDRVNVKSLPAGYSKVPDSIVQERFKAIDDYYFGNPPGTRSMFDEEYAKASPDAQKRMQTLKSSYMRQRDKVKGILMDPSKVAYKDGSFAVIGRAGSGWSLMPTTTFDQHFGYIAGTRTSNGQYSNTGFTPSRFLTRMPTKPPTGAAGGLKKKILAQLDDNQSKALQKEQSWIKERLAKAGIADSQTLNNYAKLDISHLESGDAKKKWTEGKVTPDTGLINKYIQYRIPKGQSKLEKALMSVEKDPVLAKSLGLDKGRIAYLKKSFATIKSGHPTTSSEFKMLRAIADFETTVFAKNPGMLSGTRNAGVLGGIVAEYIDTFKKKGTSGKRVVVDLSTMERSNLAAVRRGGNAKDTQLALMGKDEGVLTKAGVRTARAMGGPNAITTMNRGRIPGRAIGYDPTNPIQNKVVTYGTTGEVTPEMRARRKMEERAEKIRKLEEKKARQLEKENALRLKSMDTVDDINREQLSTKERMRAYSGKLAVGAGAVSGLTLAASFAGGKIGEIANAALPFMFAIQGVATALPLLMNPWVAGAAAVAAVGLTILKFNKDIENARKEGRDLANSMSMTSDKLQKLSEMAGTVSASEEANRRRADILAGDTSEASRKYGQDILASDWGKSLLNDISVMQGNGKNGSQIAEQLSSSLSYAIMQGVVTPEQARGIAAALGEELGSYEISMMVSGKLTSLFGFNGEDLKNNPLRIGVVAQMMQEQSMKQTQQSFSAAQQGQRSNTLDYATAGGAAALGGIAAAGLAFGGANFWNPAGWAAIAASAVVIAKNLIEANEISQKNNKLNAAAVQDGINQVAQNQGIVDSINKRFEILKAQAKTQKDINELERLRVATVADANKRAKEQLDYLIKQSQTMDAGAMDTAIQSQIDTLYKDSPLKAIAESAKTTLSEMSNTKFKSVLQFELASGNLDPRTVTSLIDMYKNDPTVEQKYNLLVQTTGSDADAATVLQLLSSSVETASIPIYMDFFNKDPKNFATNFKALQTITNMQGKYGVTVDLKSTGTKEIEEAAVAINAIKDLPDPLTKDMAMKLMQTGTADQQALMKQVVDNWDYMFGKSKTVKHKLILDFVAAQNTNYVQQYMAAMGITRNKFGKGSIGSRSFTAYQNNPETQAKAAAWWIKQMGLDVNGETPPKGGGGGGTEPKASPLDDLVKKLRDVQKNTLKATTGFEASQKAINSMFGKGKTIATPFSGIEQDLRKMKGSLVSEDFISFITGMDPAEFEAKKKKLFKFDNAGNIVALQQDAKNINAAFASINIGQFQSDNEKVLRQVQNEGKAYDILKKTGIDAAIAIEMVKDESLAAAVATGSIDPSKLKQIAELLNKIKTDSAGLSFKELMGTKEGQTQLFEEGYGKAMERFAALEAGVDAKYADQVQKFKDDIDASNKKIAGLNDQIATYNTDLEQIELKEKDITKAYDARLTALDNVKNINEEILRQQKQQLTIAGALTSGDIAAAAMAAQEMRQQNAQAAQERLTKGLESAKELAIASLTNAAGLTRAQIEEKIRLLKADINKEEKDNLKAKQDQLDALLKTIEQEKANLEVAGLTKAEWNNIKTATDLAKTSGDAYTTAINNALTAAKALWTEWNNFKDKTIFLNIVERYVKAGSGGGGGNDIKDQTDTKNTTPPQLDMSKITNQSKTTAAAEEVERVVSSLTQEQLDKNFNGDIGQAEMYYSDQMAKNLAPRIGGMLKGMFALSSGGMVPKYFKKGGFAIGTDTVPAMLTPGEFVIKKYAVDNFGVDRLRAINNGSYAGESVYNYDISVNVKSDANADDIARTVIAQIKQVDSKRLRGL